MKSVSITRPIKRLMGVSLVALLVAVATFTLPASALSLPASCNDATNEVFWCGAGSVSALQTKYHQGDGHHDGQNMADIFSYGQFGISSADVDAMDSTAVAGIVTKNGNVYIQGRTDPVATGAITAGRSDIAGSQKVTNGSATFYVRSTGVSFASNRLDAYVVMKNGVFQFAILSSCGNPIYATAVQPPKPQPKPMPQTPQQPQQPKPQPTPAPECTNFNIVAGDDRTVKVSEFSYDSKGATFTNAVINWGDQNTSTISNTTQVIGQTHKFGADNSYTIAVTVNFTQAGKAVAATGAACQRQVVFKTNTPPVVTAPPTQLTNTGPGSAIGLFAGVSAAGALGHRYFLKRRLN